MNDDGDDDVGLAVTQKRMAPLDGAQALDGRGEPWTAGGEDAVGEQRRAADHGG